MLCFPSCYWRKKCFFPSRLLCLSVGIFVLHYNISVTKFKWQFREFSMIHGSAHDIVITFQSRLHGAMTLLTFQCGILSDDYNILVRIWWNFLERSVENRLVHICTYTWLTFAIFVVPFFVGILSYLHISCPSCILPLFHSFFCAK